MGYNSGLISEFSFGIQILVLYREFSLYKNYVTLSKTIKITDIPESNVLPHRMKIRESLSNFG